MTGALSASNGAATGLEIVVDVLPAFPGCAVAHRTARRSRPATGARGEVADGQGHGVVENALGLDEGLNPETMPRSYTPGS